MNRHPRKTITGMVTLFAGAFVTTAAAQTPVQSFEQLSSVASPGMSVVVTTIDGHSTTGKIVSLSGSTVVIDRRRLFFGSERVSLSALRVRRVEKNDSTSNGALIGASIGAGATAVACLRHTNEEQNWACLFWAGVGPGAGVAIGELIDRSIRQPLYVAHTRVQLQPLTGLRQAGLVARIAF